MRRMWTLSALLGVHLAAIAATPLDAHITLSVSKDRGMHADIVLSHPVTRLEFGRQADGLRARIWQSEDRRLVMDGDAIISTDHKPFRHVPLKLLPYSEPVTLNYAVMQQFSDGSVSLYTGYFDLAGDADHTYFHFVSDGTPPLLFGYPVRPEHTWESDGQGTYVYFGSIKPIDTQLSSLVLEPTLPAWMQDTLDKVTATTADYYARGFGAPLGFRAFLLFNWTDRDNATHRDLSGDTLHGVIRYTLGGAVWAQDTPDNRMVLARVVSHEMAHFWNSELFHPDQEQGGNWMAEGQSEAVALETGLHFGWLDRDYVLSRYDDLVSECIGDPDPGPIGLQQNEAAIYGCGVSIELMLQASLSRRHADGGLMLFWNSLFAHARQTKGTYTEQDFISVLRRLGGDEDTATAVETLVEKPAADRRALVLGALGRLGVTYGVSPPAPDDLQKGRAAMQPLMSAIMAADCGGHARFAARHDDYLIASLPGCHVLTRPYTVTALDGHPVFARTADAYAAATADCEAQKPISLMVEGDDKPIAIPCPSQLPPLPQFVSLQALPWWPAQTASP